MTLWFYQIWPKVVWKMVHGLMDTRTKTKTIPNTKNKSPLFFRTVYHSKNHVIPHRVITDFGRHLEYLTMLKTTCLSNSPNTTAVENYQKIVINCHFDFRFNLRFKWRPSWTPS